ncbi:HD-GYP domain-containing protein [Thalassotalea sp. PP2-459]|uniref:HD-GYP domain-containing protein n=1 Tax=Thalassotalea sp. PP2-459 TaxID=1742724 RepID=UPI00094409CF|nr:HD domain-containing phosphohydrolase [Thalassotalea sp. PP2-459]OKY26367.1 hypothetical protein BI291_12365 [Thalassotalea sp. PP2-459]
MDLKVENNEHYINHLTDVSTTNKVVAVENIYNTFGVLLVPKGTAIEHRVQEFLVGHKMQSQLDELITVQGCLTNTSLEKEFQQFLKKYPDLIQIHNNTNFASILNQLCAVKQIPRVLLQKLTIMKIQLPDLFEQTLFSTWLACLLAKEMKLTLEHINHTFYIGLLHDIGLLHIDPTLVSKQSNFTDKEWDAFKQHIKISLAIAKLIHPFGNEVLRGIKEHHERCDGSGYPMGLHNSQLGNLGQLVGLADLICHIRTRQFDKSGKSMANILPYLQINSHAFKFEFYQAMYTILQRSQLDSAELIDRQTFTSLPKRIILKRIRIMQLHLAFNDFIAHIPENISGKHYKALLDANQQINNIIKRGGFDSAETLDWLESIKEDDYNEVHQELQELDDLQYEILWLFKKVFRIVPSFLTEELPEDCAAKIRLDAQMETLGQNLLQAWADYQ